MYVASSSESLPSLFKLYRWGLKWACPRGHMFYIGLFVIVISLTILYKGKCDTIFLSETTSLKALIFGM